MWENAKNFKYGYFSRSTYCNCKQFCTIVLSHKKSQVLSFATSNVSSWIFGFLIQNKIVKTARSI